MAEVAAIDVTRVDPASVPGGAAAVARAGGLAVADVASHGAVVVSLGDRRTVLDREALASYDMRGDGVALSRLAVEQQLAGALARLAQTTPLTACATSGHGELPLEPTEADRKAGSASWDGVAARLRGDGIAIETLPPDGAVPARCSVVVVAGPIEPLAPAQALAIQDFVGKGGGLLVAAAGRPARGGGLASTGLDAVLAADGLALPAAIAVDPQLAVREIPGALLVSEGYAEHAASAGSAGARSSAEGTEGAAQAINRGFQRERATLWYPPRVVTASGGATALVTASPASYGERDLEHTPQRDDDDLPGPSVLAAVGARHRIVVLGSAESLSGAVLAGGVSALDLWVDQAVRWLAGAPEPRVAVAAQTPAQVRQVMTSGERAAAIATCVAGIPLAWLVIGGALVWWRRRRAE